MRLIKMTGGLGNQMFIYAMYMNMKRAFPDTRIDLSDMVHYDVHNGYELHRIFDLPEDEFLINQKVKKVVEFLFFKTILERKQNLDTLEAYKRKYSWPLIYFKGFYQSERYFKDIEADVRRAFSFKENLLNEKSRQMLRQIDADPYSVSFHVRRGDYLDPHSWTNTGSICQLPYYQNLISAIKEHLPHAHFYVFSDGIDWVRENLQLSGDTFIDFNKKHDSWQDMMLMSHCRSNAICNSTFSWWGAWLNSNKEKKVFAPDRWFRNSDMPYLIPDTWIKIPTEWQSVQV